MSAVISGLVGAVLAIVIVAMAVRRQRPARTDSDGWKTLRPSWLVNVTIAGSAGITALISYVLLFVGSSRSDGTTQMIYALILAITFAAMTIYATWIGYGRTIMWKGDALRIRHFGRDTLRRIPDIWSITGNEALGEYQLVFRDGSTLRLSAYLHGSEELVARLRASARED
ncbi:hypothetical protein [Sphingomonas sp.]|uniref:hypothetical protein n=1 Tax=Sphingomonas sp. TaxID=28214 RepID=UPI003D6CDA00